MLQPGSDQQRARGRAVGATGGGAGSLEARLAALASGCEPLAVYGPGEAPEAGATATGMLLMRGRPV